MPFKFSGRWINSCLSPLPPNQRPRKEVTTPHVLPALKTNTSGGFSKRPRPWMISEAKRKEEQLCVPNCNG